MDAGYRSAAVDFAELLHQGSEEEQEEAETILEKLLASKRRPSDSTDDGVAAIRAREVLNTWRPMDPSRAVTVRTPEPVASRPATPASRAGRAKERRWPLETQFSVGEKHLQLLDWDSDTDTYRFAQRTRRETGPGYWVGEIRYTQGNPVLDRLRVVSSPLRFCNKCGGSGILNYAIQHQGNGNRLDAGLQTNRYQGRFDERCGWCDATGLAR